MFKFKSVVTTEDQLEDVINKHIKDGWYVDYVAQVPHGWVVTFSQEAE